MFGFFTQKKRASKQRDIFLYNTYTAQTERFVPHERDHVTLYTCGPTVYDYAHIGNFRAYVTADILKRTLTHNGYTVEHTMNLTDFGHLTSDADEGEDKMMRALSRAGKAVTRENMLELAAHYADIFKDEMEEMHNLPPTQYTPASEYIEKQIALVRTLTEKGYTYETGDGLYFDTATFHEYGKLGNVDLAHLKEGARISSNPEKRNATDFAVWKFGALGWESPWGTGFPGWHIECTAMAFATLGKQIDIHTGGQDLIPTHHNGEIAQAEAATGKKPFVRYWVHNAFITVDKTKLSKSLGNAITLRGLKDRGFSPTAYRYWLLTGHYRSPMNFSFEALTAARQALFRLKRFLVEEAATTDGTVLASYAETFHEAINDDLDTPRAIALLWELLKDDNPTPADKAATMRHFDTVLALGLSDSLDETKQALGVVSISDLPDDVQILVHDRERARKQRDFDTADQLREAINLKGYLVEDTPHGPRLEKTKPEST